MRIVEVGALESRRQVVERRRTAELPRPVEPKRVPAAREPRASRAVAFSGAERLDIAEIVRGLHLRHEEAFHVGADKPAFPPRLTLDASRNYSVAPETAEGGEGNDQGNDGYERAGDDD